MESKLAIQVQMPPKAVLRAMFESCLQALADTPEDIVAPLGTTAPLPAIGAEFHGGLYAGITVRDNTPMALVLLPGDEQKNWRDAGAWAEAQGGVLPSRFDMLVLYQNAKDQFQKEWHWTDTLHPAHADFAFIQSFNDGYQTNVRKDYDCRARAVRRVAI